MSAADETSAAPAKGGKRRGDREIAAKLAPPGGIERSGHRGQRVDQERREGHQVMGARADLAAGDHGQRDTQRECGERQQLGAQHPAKRLRGVAPQPQGEDPHGRRQEDDPAQIAQEDPRGQSVTRERADPLDVGGHGDLGEDQEGQAECGQRHGDREPQTARTVATPEQHRDRQAVQRAVHLDVHAESEGQPADDRRDPATRQREPPHRGRHRRQQERIDPRTKALEVEQEEEQRHESRVRQNSPGITVAAERGVAQGQAQRAAQGPGELGHAYLPAEQREGQAVDQVGRRTVAQRANLGGVERVVQRMSRGQQPGGGHHAGLEVVDQ